MTAADRRLAAWLLSAWAAGSLTGLAIYCAGASRAWERYVVGDVATSGRPTRGCTRTCAPARVHSREGRGSW